MDPLSQDNSRIIGAPAEIAEQAIVVRSAVDDAAALDLLNNHRAGLGGLDLGDENPHHRSAGVEFSG
jgi:hypothetical protein